jgi:hypothetical protein
VSGETPIVVKKPLAFAESRIAKSIRYSDAEWAVFTEGGRVRDIDASTFARECSLIGANVISIPALMEVYVRVLSGIQRPGSVGRASYANSGA